MTLHIRRAAALLFALCVAAGVTSCAAEHPDARPAAGEQVSSAETAAGTEQELSTDDEGDTGRIFDSSDDAVISAVETAFKSKNANAEWDGTVLRIRLDGSVESLTAYIPCSAAEALFADGESAILVFSDGELICSERNG